MAMTNIASSILKPVAVQLVIMLLIFLFPLTGSAADAADGQPAQVIEFQPDGASHSPDSTDELLELRKKIIAVTAAGATLFLVVLGLFAMQHRLRNENRQRKMAEQALSDSLERYRSLADLSPDGILVNFEGRFTYANPAVLRMLGAEEADQVIGRPALDFIEAEYHELVRRRIAQVLRQHALPAPIEQRWLRVDGSAVVVEVSAGATTWQGKSAVQVLLRDISERKRAEEALRVSQERLRLQFENMPVGCIMWDMDCIVRSWNPAAESIFEYTAEEAIGRNANELIIPADIRIELDAVWQSIVESDCTVYSINRNRTKSDRLITCEWANTPFSDSNGALSGAISMVQDVTVRLEHEKERLKIEKLESIGVLAGGIAHDFNNILTGILGNITFAQMFVDASHKACKPLAEAEKASLRAGELAQQLLSFARGGEPVKKAVSVRLLASEAVSLMLRGSNVKAAVEIPDSLHAIEADGGQISQVFNNIIINATHAMPGGGTLTVSAGNETLSGTNRFALPAGNYVRIAFSDQGCGIAESDLKRIFDPYFSTKVTGSGLGLASAHSIVSRHGGSIGVTSGVGRGTTFTIHLPSLAEIYQEHDSGSDTQSAGDHQGGSILVMDDEQMIRDLA
ncbi:MAG: PAS domain S-box protein, partial [Steroidobacteraceae bacterium]|nr:PAS domain S-box protein [Deltaproteobacteria bacterium]